MCKKLRIGILKRKQFFFFFLLLFFNFISLAQQKITVTGSVTSDNNTPLAGVSIKVKGASGGTTTDANGAYTLQVNKDAVLIFSSVGYEDQQLKADNGGPMASITLVSKNSALGEVVVIGYGSLRKRDLTGSVATLDNKLIKSLPVASIDQKMIGQVAGVQVQQLTGSPGGGTSVKIRGSGSLGAGIEPYMW